MYSRTNIGLFLTFHCFFCIALQKITSLFIFRNDNEDAARVFLIAIKAGFVIFFILMDIEKLKKRL